MSTRGRVAEPAGELAQHDVAERMPMVVVDPLEMVQVEHEHAQLVAEALARRPRG
jgi:hypothetical protein